jgi:hypothetical protein
MVLIFWVSGHQANAQFGIRFEAFGPLGPLTYDATIHALVNSGNVYPIGLHALGGVGYTIFSASDEADVRLALKTALQLEVGLGVSSYPVSSFTNLTLTLEPAIRFGKADQYGDLYLEFRYGLSAFLDENLNLVTNPVVNLGAGFRLKADPVFINTKLGFGAGAGGINVLAEINLSYVITPGLRLGWGFWYLGVIRIGGSGG